MTDQDVRAPEAFPLTDGFGPLGLDPRLQETLKGLGYEEPTPIQLAAIPVLLDGRDLLAEAPTGTGKTAAFALPMVQRLAATNPSDGARAEGRVGSVVLVPTRELAMQVSEAIHRYGEQLHIRVLPIYGGQAISQQLRQLRRGVDVVVATPGRAVDHLTRGTLALGEVSMVVLDEADEMLDMGFADDLEALLTAMPKERQTALFSATISAPIARIARRHLRDPERVSIGSGRRAGKLMADLRQVAYVVRRADKLAALGRILDLEDGTSTLVFARTRGEVDDLAERLSGRGRDAAALHGGLSQEQRDRIMSRFRAGQLDLLVATDVAARGLDIEHVSHVVNYDIPSNPDVYVHRVGRTGRAGRSGVAITLVEPREHRLLANIERHVGTRLELARVPTVADLHERRLDLLGASVREALLEDGRDRFRPVIEPLLDEFDVIDVALAAIQVADRAVGQDGADETDIAPATLFDHRPPRTRPTSGGRGPAARPTSRPSRPRPRTERSPDGRWTRLWVGAGRQAGMRPQDLVGAITGEAGVTGDSIGAIQIADRYSLVEVPESAADDIVRALSSATIKGRRQPVRLDREQEVR
jgi:ATP-dependent RNA helicase DeaD